MGSTTKKVKVTNFSKIFTSVDSQSLQKLLIPKDEFSILYNFKVTKFEPIQKHYRVLFHDFEQKIQAWVCIIPPKKRVFYFRFFFLKQIMLKSDNYTYFNFIASGTV